MMPTVPKEYSIQIEPSLATYRCAVHGDIVEVMTFWVANKQVAAYCSLCYFDWVGKNLLKLEKLP